MRRAFSGGSFVIGHMRLLVVVVVLAGCGTSPKNFKPPQEITVIELQEMLALPSSRGLSGKAESYLEPGRYVAKYDDGKGVYHEGPQSCYRVKLVDAGWSNPKEWEGQFLQMVDCGIYVPHDPEAKARVYVVFGTDRGVFAPTAAGPQTLPPETANEIAMRSQPTPGADPVATGVGAGIATGLISTIGEAERGNVSLLSYTVDRKALQITTLEQSQ